MWCNATLEDWQMNTDEKIINTKTASALSSHWI